MSRVALASETSLRFGATVFQQVAATGQRRRNIVAWDRLTSLIDHLPLGDSMAYRRSRGKTRGRKPQPAVMQMTFELPASSAAYIDLALAASIANRRGYKQQNSNWVVGQFELFNPSSSTTGTVTIQKLPETWVLDNAYTKSKALWERMQEQVLETEPDIEGRYADYKIGMDEDHVTQTIQDANNPTGKILTPQDATGGFTVADFNTGIAPVADWDFSKLRIPNDGTSGVTGEYTMHAVGANTNITATTGSKSLIAGYQLSRARPNQIDPNVPITEGWMNELFDDGEQLEEIRDDLNTDNDRAPYPVGAETAGPAYYPGGPNEQLGLQIHSLCNFTATTVSQKNSIMGGMFRNGLMKITNNVATNLVLILHMVPGSHRGYMVEEC